MPIRGQQLIFADMQTSTNHTLTIATRRSPLALWQSQHVATLLGDEHIRLLPLNTRGDQWLDRSLADAGGKGLFLKELEQALLNDQADLAVHSMKDIPAEMDQRLCIGAILSRATPWDAWVSNEYPTVQDLPAGATVGTSSPRRQMQLKQQRPDLHILPVRGNVQTRLEKLDSGQCHGLLLACAGLERLEMQDRITQKLQLPDWIPAAAQGAIAVQCRSDDLETRRLLETLHADNTARLVEAERQVAAELGADCHAALAVYAEQYDNQVTLHARYGPDPIDYPLTSSPMVQQQLSGPLSNAIDMAIQLADNLQQALSNQTGGG